MILLLPIRSVLTASFTASSINTCSVGLNQPERHEADVRESCMFGHFKDIGVAPHIGPYNFAATLTRRTERFWFACHGITIAPEVKDQIQLWPCGGVPDSR
ncbi:hypothetical protein C8Q69DRAFT_463657 [Paecilomyces variotii]|uniref:Uncharacterized protein n=1 Tax=Byssochlamys spectabilis TaxID=264951 RepID=A0A443HW26_BYSSP|nr:hypothetical protein C8Q69DRAFT_463657 [Paecilomyces variotii]RWQ96045.1 hypothetical protein C8Q69DRAFT_463657 [Paecilomyces variotii]